MKIIVLHGDNSFESYLRLQKFIDSGKGRNWEIIRIVTPTADIAEILSSTSLFTKKRLVTIEDPKFLTKRVVDWLKKKGKNLDLTLILYSKSTLTKTFLNSLPVIEKVEEFKLPKLIWSFLDSFYPGNGRNCLLILHKLSPSEPLEFVFTLLAKTLRDLYWVKIDPKGVTLPSWRLQKLMSQSHKFTEKELKDIIADLAEIDIKTKTSQAELASELDFLIASKLE